VKPIAPTPLLVLQACAEARAILFDLGEFASLDEATTPLVDFAYKSGVVEQIGWGAVRQLIAAAFGEHKTTNE
jgi:hypothetical protein